MGKIIPALFMLFALQLGSALFLGVDFPGSSLYQAITGVYNWEQEGFINFIVNNLAIIGGFVVVVGLTAWRSDFAFYAGISAVFVGFAQGYAEMYQIISAYNVIPDILVLTLFSPFILSWFIIVLDWIRGRD